MKKILVLLLTICTLFTLSACKQESKLVGAYEENEKEMDEQLTEIFEKAQEGYTGMSFKPIKLLETQVVAGTNYKFLAEATLVTPDKQTSKKIVTIYQDLDGNCSISDVQDYE